jgi:D-serine deaminase-like pyridoxal phosphate-dependent protein
MTHAGDSYGCTDADGLRAMAAQERDLCLLAATRLRGEGYECPVVSIGSTPTALNVEHLQGITEVRVGVYTFFDLVQAGLGVCAIDDIAVSVLATVIGVQVDQGRVITDAGWMALSRDLGTAEQVVDQGYGLVCAADGTVFGDVIVSGANQEHGIVSRRDGGLPALAIGDLVRVLPNHACAVAGQHGHFHVVEGEAVLGTWGRVAGW